MPTPFQDTADMPEVEVLPAEGPQPVLDMAYRFGNSIRQNATWFLIGAIVGGIAIVYITSRNRG